MWISFPKHHIYIAEITGLKISTEIVRKTGDTFMDEYQVIVESSDLSIPLVINCADEECMKTVERKVLHGFTDGLRQVIIMNNLLEADPCLLE